MLCLLFRLGPDRYAIPARLLIELVPLVPLRPIPGAPATVAGLLNYRAQMVPVIDLHQLTTQQPAPVLLSTRILLVQCKPADGKGGLLGLIATHATEMTDLDTSKAADISAPIRTAPFLSKIVFQNNEPIQFVDLDGLLTTPLRHSLFSAARAVTA